MDSESMMLDSNVNVTDQNVIYVDGAPINYNVDDGQHVNKFLIKFICKKDLN